MREKWCKPPEGSPEFCTVLRGLRPSEARPPAERSEAARKSSGGPDREVAITKKLKKVPPESPGEPLILKKIQKKFHLFFFFFFFFFFGLLGFLGFWVFLLVVLT